MRPRARGSRLFSFFTSTVDLAASSCASALCSGVDTLLFMQMPPPQGCRLEGSRENQPFRMRWQRSSTSAVLMLPAARAAVMVAWVNQRPSGISMSSNAWRESVVLWVAPCFGWVLGVGLGAFSAVQIGRGAARCRRAGAGGKRRAPFGRTEFCEVRFSSANTPRQSCHLDLPNRSPRIQKNCSAP